LSAVVGFGMNCEFFFVQQFTGEKIRPMRNLQEQQYQPKRLQRISPENFHFFLPMDFCRPLARADNFRREFDFSNDIFFFNKFKSSLSVS
jgi:hypothetical protein